jgi:hypothetical protein
VNVDSDGKSLGKIGAATAAAQEKMRASGLAVIRCLERIGVIYPSY